MTRWIMLLTPTLLVGCLLGPQHRLPEVSLPDTILVPGADENHGADWLSWWQQFNDPALDLLVATATRDNLDLQQQAARVRAARAELGFADAERWPTVDVQAEASRNQQPAAAFGFDGAASGPRSLFSVSGALGYELDLWGRLARGREAASALLASEVYAREALRLAVIADVVNTYFEIRAALRSVQITEEAIATRERAVALQTIRYEAGMVDRLVLLQVQSELAAAKSQLPEQRQQLGRLETALAILVGSDPRQLFQTFGFGDVALADLRLIEALPPVLPSEMLARRPDIRAADAALQAANAGIGQAMAQRLPSINLFGMVGSIASETGDWLTSGAEAWGLGTSVLGPVVDFGRGRSRVEVAEAERDRAALRYLATVQVAFGEVRDALMSFETSRERVESLQRQVSVLKETEALAEVRYDGGASIFLEVLDARRALLDAELALSQAEQQQLSASATLFKALGGGWDPDAVAADDGAG